MHCWEWKLHNKKVLVEQIDELLPQTQCAECGYNGCKPYATAIASGLAPINLCPPGGKKTIQALGDLLSVDVAQYLETGNFLEKSPQIAKIREEECIGCTKCISACPVDAIIGTNKHMHTVIEFECTGCGLCIEPCPVDCIDMLDVEDESHYDRDKARERFQAKKIRELKSRQIQNEQYLKKRKLVIDSVDNQADTKAKQDYILQALERAKRKRQNLDE